MYSFVAKIGINIDQLYYEHKFKRALSIIHGKGEVGGGRHSAKYAEPHRKNARNLRRARLRKEYGGTWSGGSTAPTEERRGWIFGDNMINVI